MKRPNHRAAKIGVALGFVGGLAAPYLTDYLLEIAGNWIGSITIQAVHQHWQYEQQLRTMSLGNMQEKM